MIVSRKNSRRHEETAPLTLVVAQNVATLSDETVLIPSGSQVAG